MLPLLTIVALSLSALSSARSEFQAGAAVVDVTPSKFPVLVNGGMTTRSATEVVSPIRARAIVVSYEETRIGIVVVDSCMMPRPLLDEAKKLASAATKLKADHILISATHTHTAPSSMGALGTDADTDYLPVLRAGIVEAIVEAERNLEPATVGWAVENAARFTAVRRWIRRSDRIADDPFGNKTVRANMHAARNLDDVVGESGPEDPDLSMISLQAPDGRPIALLANFSMHYFSGPKPLSSDYFGLFCEGLENSIGQSVDGRPPFVAIMSHGCSGDIWRRDYRLPAGQQDPFESMEDYASQLVQIAMKGYARIEHHTPADLAMFEARPTLKYRTPDVQRLQWATAIVDELGDRPPKTQTEVYAREQLFLHERQQTEVVVQGLRIGDIAIATTPNETYALTGLKLKQQSPLQKTMVIELANGGDGYIPPPEQHLLGGYNTWAARSAGLEVRAESVITETALQLLERATNAIRRDFQQSQGATSVAVADAKPTAWYRLDEMAGQWAKDSSPHQRHAVFEPGVAYFLEGPLNHQICTDDEVNRAVHFAGGRLCIHDMDRSDEYSMSVWIWNGLPTDARDVTGWIYSAGRNGVANQHAEHLGLAGTQNGPGQLIYEVSGQTTIGKTVVPRWKWSHLVLTGKGAAVRIYLNGILEISADRPAQRGGIPVFIGGRCDGSNGWEGRLDEVCFFDRVLSAAEIKAIGGPQASVGMAP